MIFGMLLTLASLSPNVLKLESVLSVVARLIGGILICSLFQALFGTHLTGALFNSEYDQLKTLPLKRRCLVGVDSTYLRFFAPWSRLYPPNGDLPFATSWLFPSSALPGPNSFSYVGPSAWNCLLQSLRLE